MTFRTRRFEIYFLGPYTVKITTKSRLKYFILFPYFLKTNFKFNFYKN